MSEFRKVASVDEVPEDGGLDVEVEGVAMALFRLDGGVVALDALCPHRAGPLAEGEVDEGVVICPWHGWEFELRSGACLTDPSQPLRRYPVQVRGSEVWVRPVAE